MAQKHLQHLIALVSWIKFFAFIVIQWVFLSILNKKILPKSLYDFFKILFFENFLRIPKIGLFSCKCHHFIKFSLKIFEKKVITFKKINFYNFLYWNIALRSIRIVYFCIISLELCPKNAFLCIIFIYINIYNCWFEE